MIVAIFVVASIYSTFWWNYLRTQTFETYHALFLLAFFFVLVEIHVINYAFMALGLPPEMAFAALLASLIGSYINIPVARVASSNFTTAPRSPGWAAAPTRQRPTTGSVALTLA